LFREIDFIDQPERPDGPPSMARTWDRRWRPVQPAHGRAGASTCVRALVNAQFPDL